MMTTVELENPLQSLSEISEKINTLHDLDALLREILETALKTVNAQRGFILINDDQEGGELSVKASHNLNVKSLAHLNRFSTSVVEEALRKGETILAYDVPGDKRFSTAASLVEQEIISAACLPLGIKTQRIGAVYLDSTEQRGRFRPDMEPFLNAFAHQAAVAIENAQMYDRLRGENRQLRRALAERGDFSEIIGESRAVQQVLDMIRSVMDTRATVLILGESGTGKELVARALHYNSQFKDQPFIALFCGALPETLLESELFGHKKGAFTGAGHDKKGLFEEAHGGTFFLDEIGDISPKIQAQLLRILQEREVRRIGETKVRKVDVRVVAATNKDLAAEVKEGRFREDLFYRLNVITIDMPPLRHRGKDVILLAQHALDRAAASNNRNVQGFLKETIDALLAHDWPGNVRELQNSIERAVLLCKSEFITPEDLRLQPVAPLPPGMSLRDHERRVVERTLNELEGNVTKTAEMLGVSRRWLQYRLKEWGL